MHNQPPYENQKPSVPPIQPADSYPPIQLSANPYTQSPYGQQPPVNPYTQSPYGQPPPVNPYIQSPYGQQVPISVYSQPLAGPYGPQQNIHLPSYAQAPAREPNQIVGVLSLLLGIASVFFFWLPVIGGPAAVFGIILSSVKWRSSPQKGLLLAGLILAGMSLILLSCIRFLI